MHLCEMGINEATDDRCGEPAHRAVVGTKPDGTEHTMWFCDEHMATTEQVGIYDGNDGEDFEVDF